MGNYLVLVVCGQYQQVGQAAAVGRQRRQALDQAQPMGRGAEGARGGSAECVMDVAAAGRIERRPADQCLKNGEGQGPSLNGRQDKAPAMGTGRQSVEMPELSVRPGPSWVVGGCNIACAGVSNDFGPGISNDVSS